MGKIKQSVLQNKIIFRQVYTIDNLIVVIHRYYEIAFHFNFYYIYQNSLETTSSVLGLGGVDKTKQKCSNSVYNNSKAYY